MPNGHASMLLLGQGSEATEPYNKYDKIRLHSFRSLQFDQKVRPLSFRPEKFDLFTATRQKFPFFLGNQFEILSQNTRQLAAIFLYSHLYNTGNVSVSTNCESLSPKFSVQWFAISYVLSNMMTNMAPMLNVI